MKHFRISIPIYIIKTFGRLQPGISFYYKPKEKVFIDNSITNEYTFFFFAKSQLIAKAHIHQSLINYRTTYIYLWTYTHDVRVELQVCLQVHEPM